MRIYALLACNSSRVWGNIRAHPLWQILPICIAFLELFAFSIPSSRTSCHPEFIPHLCHRFPIRIPPPCRYRHQLRLLAGRAPQLPQAREFSSLSATTFASHLMWFTVNRKICRARSHFAPRVLELRGESKMAQGAKWSVRRINSLPKSKTLYASYALTLANSSRS